MLQYRGAALGGVATQAFFGMVRIMILEGFYRSSAAAPSLSFAAAVGYVWLGQAAFTLQPYNLDREVRTMVESGGWPTSWCARCTSMPSGTAGRWPGGARPWSCASCPWWCLRR